jgi:hypothetical protein
MRSLGPVKPERYVGRYWLDTGYLSKRPDKDQLCSLHHFALKRLELRGISHTRQIHTEYFVSS